MRIQTTAILACILLLACNKQTVVDTDSLDTNRVNYLQRVTSAAVNATGICDYDLNETALVTAGWTKIFNEDFSADLSQWNIWTGGAFNNELQYY